LLSLNNSFHMVNQADPIHQLLIQNVGH